MRDPYLLGSVGARASRWLPEVGTRVVRQRGLTPRLAPRPSPPGVLAASLYAFTQAWNEFLYALVFITDVKLRTLPVGLSTFITGDVYGWGFLRAGAVLTTRPVIAVYVYLQRFMVEGLTAGSVKG